MKLTYQLALLLKFIAKKRNPAAMEAYGVRKEQIFRLLPFALAKNYIEQEKGCFVLKDEGKRWLQTHPLKHKADWIQPLLTAKTAKLANNAVYLPPLKNSWFET